jgi:hypothetical protein
VSARYWIAPVPPTLSPLREKVAPGGGRVGTKSRDEEAAMPGMARPDGQAPLFSGPSRPLPMQAAPVGPPYRPPRKDALRTPFVSAAK